MKGWKCLLVYFTHKGHRMFAFEGIISQVTIVSLQAFPCSQVFCTIPLPSWPSCFTFFQQGVVMTTHYVAHMTNCQCKLFQNYPWCLRMWGCYILYIVVILYPFNNMCTYTSLGNCWSNSSLKNYSQCEDMLDVNVFTCNFFDGTQFTSDLNVWWTCSAWHN